MVVYQPKPQENYEKAATTTCNFAIFKAKKRNTNRPSSGREPVVFLVITHRAPFKYSILLNNHSARENIREHLFCQQKTEYGLCTK